MHSCCFFSQLPLSFWVCLWEFIRGDNWCKILGWFAGCIMKTHGVIGLVLGGFHRVMPLDFVLVCAGVFALWNMLGGDGVHINNFWLNMVFIIIKRGPFIDNGTSLGICWANGTSLDDFLALVGPNVECHQVTHMFIHTQPIAWSFLGARGLFINLEKDFLPELILQVS